MNPGCRQDQRLAAALRPGYFLPDELDLAERLAMTLGYAAHLRFPGAGPEQTWDAALLRDPSVVLADIAAFPLEASRAAYLAALARDEWTLLWRQAWGLAQRIERWRYGLADHDEQLAQRLRDLIERNLGPLMQEGIARFGPYGDDGDLAHPCWRQAATAVAADAGDTLLRRIGLALHQAISQILPLARSRFAASLGGGRHDPSLGLLLAILRLFQETRGTLNRFPERLADFYHHDLLHLRPRSPGQEQAHLLLEREPRFDGAVVIETGMRFVGGKDDRGKAIEFAADHGLEVGDTRVAALCSLRLECDPLISPEREFGYATRARAERLPPQASDAPYAAQPAWWPLLGGRAKTSAAAALDAEFGLALASPLLALAEGEREVRISLRLAHPANGDEALLSLLKMAPAQRSPAWLAQTFARLEAWERQQHRPPRRPGPLRPPPDAAAMADAAWRRGDEFGEDVLLAFLLARCLASDDSTTFAQRLGRLFAAWLVAPREDLRGADLTALRQYAAALPKGVPSGPVEIDDPLSLIQPGAPAPERPLIFERLFHRVWAARFSTAAGWTVAGDVYASRDESTGNSGQGNLGGGIELTLRLEPDYPAVVACREEIHGPGWPRQAMLQLHLRAQSRVYGYSLLRQLALLDVGMAVTVRGLRDVVVHNQLGRLDPGKPFLPFGPLPDSSSYLVIGSPELAAKPLHELHFHLKWGRLPTLEGGFPAHYAGYPGNWNNGGFRVRPRILRDGHWQFGDGASLALFGSDSRRLGDSAVLTLPEADLRRFHRAGGATGALEYGLHSRDGFFRLDLAEPDTGFGHGLYPALLTEALTRNARLKRPDPLPREPYTPTLESLTVDYRASRTLHLGEAAGGQLFHLHPFGREPLRLASAGQPPRLLPDCGDDGNLYIGLDGGVPGGTLSLYFQLRRGVAADCVDGERPQPAWSIWRGGGWQPLDRERVLSDGTQGFLRSGIVRLDLPGDLARGCPSLPGDLHWLRLSADWGFDTLAGLYGVHAQAISVTRVEPAAADTSRQHLPPGSIRAPLRSVAGLRGVCQVGPSFGRGQAETQAMTRARAAERLHHKDRAATAWDYERLLLDAFPELHKVKCFPHQTAQSDVAAGHVLVVVVPAPRQGDLFDLFEAPRVDAARLEEMAEHLRARAPGGARIVVRNAAYERVQVRCAARLGRGVHPGTALRRINQAIVEHLSPWHPDGQGDNFAWEVRGSAIEARLRALDGVAAVVQLSLLHIVSNDDHVYALHDTARAAGQPLADGDDPRVVRAAQPWSLLLPTHQHLIELAGDPAWQAARPTGIDRLEVGNTFIVAKS